MGPQTDQPVREIYLVTFRPYARAMMNKLHLNRISLAARCSIQYLNPSSQLQSEEEFQSTYFQPMSDGFKVTTLFFAIYY